MKDWVTVRMFRCVQDPMIGPKPRQAFMIPDLPDWKAFYHVPSGTVHVVTPFNKRIHVVGAGNLNKVELEGEYGPFEVTIGEDIQEASTKNKRHQRTLTTA